MVTVGETRTLIGERFGWLQDFDLADQASQHYWWVTSDNAEEPRRTERAKLDPSSNDVSIDIGHQIRALDSTLQGYSRGVSLGTVLAEHRHHLQAAKRLFSSDRRYGEIRDNACAVDYLPLQIQRFQLAMYGMDNFKPKSTDWLRVTLYQGAPRLADLSDPEFMLEDSWALPALPPPQDKPAMSNA